jgi:hypothetical protein
MQRKKISRQSWPSAESLGKALSPDAHFEVTFKTLPLLNQTF